MKTVLAALDNSGVAASVAAAGRSLASMFEADVAGVHVREDGDRNVRWTAARFELELFEVGGTPVDRLVDLLRSDEVAGMAVGARRGPGGPRPVGSTALAIVERAAKPVLVVPPDGHVGAVFRRALVPLDATIASALAVNGAVCSAVASGVELVVLHVFGDGTVPRFWDQPIHEEHAWADEFLNRFCDQPGARVALRTGAPGQETLAVAEEEGVDLILLAWSQTFAGGHAELVREVLAYGEVPVLLVPLETAHEVAA